jgi:hypothetical protein
MKLAELPPDGPIPEPLATIREYVRRVDRDVMATTSRPTRCRVYGPGPDGEYFVGDGPMATFLPGQDREEFLARLADELSEAVSEDLANRGDLSLAQSWPPCPEHGHSLDPAVVAGRAVWRCRSDNRIQVPIGSLAEQERPVPWADTSLPYQRW